MILSKKLKIIYEDKIIEYPDFEIKPGDFVLVKGKSGSGKSSLIKTLSLLNLNYEGSILFEGIECRDIDESKRSFILSDRISYIAQESDLIEELTVRENIELGSRKKISEQELNRELEYFGLSGYENRKVGELSGGEKRRISIIKGILSGKDIVIIDEPFVSLGDKYTEISLKSFYEFVSCGKTLIISSNIYCDSIKSSVLIDIDKKRFTRYKQINVRHQGHNRVYIPFNKENLFSKALSGRFLRFSLIVFFSMFLMLWIKAFEFKTERYYKDPWNLSYVYKENSYFSDAEMEWFKKEKINIYPFNYKFLYIRDFAIGKYIFDNKFPFLKAEKYKLNSDTCYISENLNKYCDYIKSKENCNGCQILKVPFMGNREYVIKFKNKFKPNALFLVNDFNPGRFENKLYRNFKNKVVLKFWYCDISYYWKYLYPKLKKFSVLLNIFFAIFLSFYIYSIFYHRLDLVRIIYSNGVPFKKIYKTFFEKLLKYFYAAFILSLIVFSVFNLLVKGIIPLINLKGILTYFFAYHFLLVFLFSVSLYISLKRKIRYILTGH